MQLESPPMLQVLLFESPWALMVVFTVTGLILLSAGQKRHNKGLMLGAAGALVLAVGAYLLASSVTTDREQLKQETRDLVAATAPLDNAALNRLLAPNVTVTGPTGDVWVKAGQVLPRVQHVLQSNPLNSQSIRSLDAAAHDNGWGESAVTVHTDINGGNSLNTGWLLTWEKAPGEGTWRVVDIRWMRFNGVETPRAMLP